jgi:hypothetical protein
MPTFRYTVTYADSSGTAYVGVNACYLQEEGKLVVFKDASHAIVFAVNAAALVAVQREAELS